MPRLRTLIHASSSSGLCVALVCNARLRYSYTRGRVALRYRVSRSLQATGYAAVPLCWAASALRRVFATSAAGENPLLDVRRRAATGYRRWRTLGSARAASPTILDEVLSNLIP
eukprot:6202281-Pleurochrysis_carterae.AAC.1